VSVLFLADPFNTSMFAGKHPPQLRDIVIRFQATHGETKNVERGDVGEGRKRDKEG
jgi:hypothetical protein